MFRLGAFSRNLRNEIKKSAKIYFYDNGVRNAVIANFTALDMRTDTGALWENYLVSERMKANHYRGRWCNRYFWRTANRQEIDYLEEAGGALSAWAFQWGRKWGRKSRTRAPAAFAKAYPEHAFETVNRDNFAGFLQA